MKTKSTKKKKEQKVKSVGAIDQEKTWISSAAKGERKKEGSLQARAFRIQPSELEGRET